MIRKDGCAPHDASIGSDNNARATYRYIDKTWRSHESIRPPCVAHVRQADCSGRLCGRCRARPCAIERVALRSGRRMDRCDEVPRRRPRMERERRRDVDVVLGDARRRGSRRRLQGDLHARKLLPRAERPVRPLHRRHVLRAQRVRRHQLAVRHGDGRSPDHAPVPLDDPVQPVLRLVHVLADGVPRVPRPRHVPDLSERSGRGRRFGLEQRGVVHVAVVRWTEFRRDVRARQSGRRQRLEEVERAVQLCERPVRGDGRLSVRELQQRPARPERARRRHEEPGHRARRRDLRSEVRQAVRPVHVYEE
ncbi:hypothetical protein FEP58_05201 [Burkholderia multivorans]|nr:hypothetical protein [Burkholderia multivorans]